MNSKFTDLDVIILIGKEKNNGINVYQENEVPNIKDLENKFYLVNYYPEVMILDYCQDRRLYQVPLYKDLRNFTINYDCNNIVNEFGLIDDNNHLISCNQDPNHMDDVVWAFPTLERILSGIYTNLKTFPWKNKIKTTNDFFILKPNVYD